MKHRIARLTLSLVAGIAVALVVGLPLLLVHAASDTTIRITDIVSGLGDAEGDAGATVTMSVSATDAQDIAGLQFKIQFDNTVVKVADGGVSQGALPQGFLFVSNVENPRGVVSIIVAGAAAFNVTDLEIADIAFDLIGTPGQSTSLIFTEILASDASAQAVSISSVNGTVTIRSAVQATPTSAPAAATPTPSAPTPPPAAGATPTTTLTPTPNPTPTPELVDGLTCNGPSAGIAGGWTGMGDLGLLGAVLAGLFVRRRFRMR